MKPKAIFCSNACKQESYRRKNNLPGPTFVEKKLPIKREVKFNVEEQLVEYSQKIAEIQSAISLAKEKKNDCLERITKLEPTVYIQPAQSDLSNLIFYGLLNYGINQAVEEGKSKYKKERERERLSYLKNLVRELDQSINLLQGQKIILERQYNQLKEELKRHFENFLQSKYIEEKEEKQLKASKQGVFTIEEVKAHKFDTFDLRHDLSQTIGKPAKNFKMLVYGKSGGGKTTWVINFANYFAENFGKVLFNSSEEGIGVSLVRKLEGLSSKKMLIGQAKKFDELQRLLQSDHYDLLVIDSVNDMGLTTEQFENLCANETATIFIQQSTKTGDYKGSTQLAHDTDIVLRIENQSVEVEKTRFK